MRQKPLGGLTDLAVVRGAGELEPTNNHVERLSRGIAVWRKKRLRQPKRSAPSIRGIEAERRRNAPSERPIGA